MLSINSAQEGHKNTGMIPITRNFMAKIVSGKRRASQR